MSQKIELALLVGAESKAWLANLEKTVARLEKLQGATADTGAQTEYHEEKTRPVKTGKGKAAAAGKGKAAAAVEEDEDSFDVPSDDKADEAEETDEAAKEEAAPEITRKELVKVAKANRDAAIKWMQKRKIKSIDDLPKKLWAEFVNAFE